MHHQYQTNYAKLNFDTRVKTVEERSDGVYVELEESYFYPEGGGQLRDQGTINGKEVLDLVVKDGVLFHKLASFSGLTLNMQVKCSIDEKVRQDHTVTHSAQHVFSAFLKDDYGLNTIGFHMGKQITTIDVDGEITWDILLEVEHQVNEAISQDFKVKTYYTSLKEAQNLPLRKEIKDQHYPRIVQIGQMDYSGCGGTHVHSLKEIRLFKVVGLEKYKEGVRISFTAGQRAFAYIRELEDAMLKLKEELQTAMDEMPYRVKRLKEEKEEEHERAENLQKELVGFIARTYNEDFIIDKVHYSEDMIKALGKEIIAKRQVAVFYTPGNKVYIFTGKNISAKKILEEAKTGLDFKGGAGAHFGQGVFQEEENLLTFISHMYEVFLSLEL